MKWVTVAGNGLWKLWNGLSFFLVSAICFTQKNTGFKFIKEAEENPASQAPLELLNQDSDWG